MFLELCLQPINFRCPFAADPAFFDIVADLCRIALPGVAISTPAAGDGENRLAIADALHRHLVGFDQGAVCLAEILPRLPAGTAAAPSSRAIDCSVADACDIDIAAN